MTRWPDLHFVAAKTPFCGVKIRRVLRDLKRSFLQVVTRRNFVQSLIAVVVGNAVYFLLLVPLLPPAAHHRRERIDLGLVVDFWVCLVIYGLLEIIVRRWKLSRRRESQER
jgi:hypothetical protein